MAHPQSILPASEAATTRGFDSVHAVLADQRRRTCEAARRCRALQQLVKTNAALHNQQCALLSEAVSMQEQRARMRRGRESAIGCFSARPTSLHTAWPASLRPMTPSNLISPRRQRPTTAPGDSQPASPSYAVQLAAENQALGQRADVAFREKLKLANEIASLHDRPKQQSARIERLGSSRCNHTLSSSTRVDIPFHPWLRDPPTRVVESSGFLPTPAALQDAMLIASPRMRSTLTMSPPATGDTQTVQPTAGQHRSDILQTGIASGTEQARVAPRASKASPPSTPRAGKLCRPSVQDPMTFSAMLRGVYPTSQHFPSSVQ